MTLSNLTSKQTANFTRIEAGLEVTRRQMSALGQALVWGRLHEGWLRDYQKAASKCYTEVEVNTGLTELRAEVGKQAAMGNANYMAGWLMADERGQTETANELWSRMTKGASGITVSSGPCEGRSLSSSLDVRSPLPGFYAQILLQSLHTIIIARVRVHHLFRRGVERRWIEPGRRWGNLDLLLLAKVTFLYPVCNISTRFSLPIALSIHKGDSWAELV